MKDKNNPATYKLKQHATALGTNSEKKKMGFAARALLWLGSHLA